MRAGGSAWLERSADNTCVAETERSRVQISPGPLLHRLLLFAKRPQGSRNPHNVNGRRFFIDFCYGSDGGSYHFEGFVGTAHDGLTLLWIIINETEADLAGAVLPEKLKKSVPKGSRNVPLADWLFAHDSESEVASSHTSRQLFFLLMTRTPSAT